MRKNAICTASGVEFTPLSYPHLEDIRLEDIARALSNKCRFGGATREFYSVAQHSVLVSKLVAPEHAWWGLMHDAAEAYLPDIVTPLKSEVFVRVPAAGGGAELVPFEEAESELLYAILNQWAYLSATWPMPEEVSAADALALELERRDLMPAAPWWEAKPPGRFFSLAPSCFTIRPLPPQEAYALFMERAREIGSEYLA